MITDNMNFVVKERNNITQYLYGGDGFDIRYLKKVKYDDLLISDSEFEALYKLSSADPSTQNEMNSLFYNELLPRRNQFKQAFVYKSLAILEEEVRKTIKVPVDCKEMIKDMLIRMGNPTITPSEDDKKQMISIIKNFLADIPYIYTNERKR
jgi:hypothetical protein